MTRARTAQAQATKVTEITQRASVDLACSLVQVGIASICYVRQILPEDAFVGVNIDGLDASDNKNMLIDHNSASPEAQTISQWCTVSVAEAIKSGYATKLIFGLSSDQDCRCILEEYVFNFKHDEHGNIALASLEGGNSQKRASKKPDVNSARKQVGKLLRNIISITRTLDSVPDERYVFCKMEFSEECPVEYQPPGFEDAGDRAVGFFTTRPFTMRLGAVTTPFHDVMLGVRSILDSVDQDDVNVQKGPMGDNISRWETTVAGNSADIDACVSEGNDQQQVQQQHRDNIHLKGHTNDDLADLFSEPQDVNMHDQRSAAAAAVAAGFSEGMAERLKALSFNPTTNNATAAAAAGGGAISCAGGIHSVPGSVGTQSLAKNAMSRNAQKSGELDQDMEVVSQEEEAEVQGGGGGGGGGGGVGKKKAGEFGFWPASQVSNDARIKRKTSIVEKPIHQDNKKRKLVAAPAPTALPASEIKQTQPLKRAGLRSKAKKAAVAKER